MSEMKTVSNDTGMLFAIFCAICTGASILPRWVDARPVFLGGAVFFALTSIGAFIVDAAEFLANIMREDKK